MTSWPRSERPAGTDEPLRDLRFSEPPQPPPSGGEPVEAAPGPPGPGPLTSDPLASDPLTPAGTGRSVLHLRLPLDRLGTGSLYAQVVEALEDVTALVEPLPPDSADLDVTGALRFWDRDVRQLAVMVQLRLAGLFDLNGVGVGAAGNRLVAAMAAAATPPGEVTVVDDTPEAVAAFLRPRPVAALPGVGRATAATLERYGMRTVGALADLPLLTVQRILGAAAGRALHERAHGYDPRPVTPGAAPRHVEHAYAFASDELDPALHRAGLLCLVEDIGLGLRTERQAAGRLTLTVSYADTSASVRTRTLDEPTGHSGALALCAYHLYESLGLQRARVRALRLRADLLRAAEETPRQLTFDPAQDDARAAEAAADRVRERFGARATMPATLAALPDRRG